MLDSTSGKEPCGIVQLFRYTTGIVIAMSLSGVLCDYGFAGGWPSEFYVFGAAGCLWALAWFVLCHNTPSAHPRISLAELRYIEISMEFCETLGKSPVP